MPGRMRGACFIPSGEALARTFITALPRYKRWISEGQLDHVARNSPAVSIAQAPGRPVRKSARTPHQAELLVGVLGYRQY